MLTVESSSERVVLPGQQVRRRIVFYVPGFDPHGPSHYHRLFCEQASKQAATSAYRINVSPRQATQAHVSVWQADFVSDEGAVVSTDYRFLRWDDLVREHWPRGRWRLAGLTVQTSWRLFRNGSWWRMCRSSWVAGLTLALPFGVGLASVALTAAVASLLYVALTLATSMTTVLLGLCAALVGGMSAAVGLSKMWRFGQGDWLIRSTHSILRMARGEAAAIEYRINAWADYIAAGSSEPHVDEILVVAHSSGCMAAASALARAFRAAPALGLQGPPIGFLTLGQCIPVLSYQPEAAAFRAELKQLSQCAAITWVDVTAPPDACCFALMDPTVNPYSPNSSASSPKRISARYAEQMSPSSYAILKADKYRCHFQYLMAFESALHYDYFKWVCGPTLIATSTRHLSSVSNFTRFRW